MTEQPTQGPCAVCGWPAGRVIFPRPDGRKLAAPFLCRFDCKPLVKP